VVRQTRTLNTHARYLYESLIELAERLKASMPSGLGLDTVMLVNSGSEANEMAWRLATATTGNARAVVTEHAYHGVTTAIADMSPEEWPTGYAAANTQLISPLRLGEPLGDGVAATFVDCGFTSDGVQTPPRDELAALVDNTHAAGGLFVADEVQAGHGRGGEHLWMFESYGIAPDLVTLGKPMGNGYPVAALVGRAEIFDRFAEQTRVFSTFGGNPVAANAALAVLEVIDDERLVESSGRVGAYLRSRLERFGVPVRGRGLLVGVEMPDAAEAGRVVNAMRADGVLIGRTGRENNVLKIRPPLVFQEEHADLLVACLDRALND
jgi:4-aminobutyrate aminotransferase-like enzyme